MKFKQISGQPRLYVSVPEQGIAYVAPPGVSSGPTIEPADALKSDQLRGSFWFLPGEFKTNATESILIANTDALLQAHGGRRLLIWSDHPAAAWGEVRQRILRRLGQPHGRRGQPAQRDHAARLAAKTVRQR